MDFFEKIGGCTVFGKTGIDEILSQGIKEGKRELEPLKSFAKLEGIPFNILEDTNVVNEIEIHTNMADLWYCIEGEVTFTLGGTPVEPYAKVNKDGSLSQTEIRTERMEGSYEKVLKPGDWLWIPPNVAHSHRCEGTSRLVIIKIPK